MTNYIPARHDMRAMIHTYNHTAYFNEPSLLTYSIYNRYSIAEQALAYLGILAINLIADLEHLLYLSPQNEFWKINTHVLSINFLQNPFVGRDIFSKIGCFFLLTITTSEMVKEQFLVDRFFFMNSKRQF